MANARMIAARSTDHCTRFEDQEIIFDTLDRDRSQPRRLRSMRPALRFSRRWRVYRPRFARALWFGGIGLAADSQGLAH